MVDKQKSHIKTRFCVRIIHFTASVCFVITPILKIMYKGFPAFEAVDDQLNAFNYLSDPLPFGSPKKVGRQIYMATEYSSTVKKKFYTK